MRLSSRSTSNSIVDKKQFTGPSFFEFSKNLNTKIFFHNALKYCGPGSWFVTVIGKSKFKCVKLIQSEISVIFNSREMYSREDAFNRSC